MIFVDTTLDSAPAEHLTALLELAAKQALEHQSASKLADLTIMLADDPELHRLNKEYLGIDAATDVLSFPMNEKDPETGEIYLGDIIISVERAAKQAADAGHAPEAEMQLLTVHGVLHLLGHDHAEPEEKARMWKAQAEILGLIGLGNITIKE